MRLFVDREGGVTLDDCQKVSQFMSPVLDKCDFITGRYVLEVSSPGFDRPLRKPGDFNRFAGETIRIVAQEPIQGRRRFHGILKGLKDNMIVVDCEGQIFEIHIENLQKANLVR